MQSSRHADAEQVSGEPASRKETASTARAAGAGAGLIIMVLLLALMAIGVVLEAVRYKESREGLFAIAWLQKTRAGAK